MAKPKCQEGTRASAAVGEFWHGRSAGCVKGQQTSVQYLDADHGVNTAINRLREALGDSADNPRFIETLPRRGYRFIAPVEPSRAVSQPAPAVSSMVPEAQPAPATKARVASHKGRKFASVSGFGYCDYMQLVDAAAIQAHLGDYALHSLTWSWPVRPIT